jgi:hypothetical protein
MGDNSDLSQGWMSYSLADGRLTLAAGNSAGLFVHSNGNVSVGSSSDNIPQLAVIESDSGRSWATNSATGLIVERAGDCRLTIAASAGNDSILAFGDPSDEDVGRISYEHGTDTMRFVAATGTRATITSTGLSVNGALSKTSGSFKIDHPVKPNTHYLVHSFVEAPQADNIYRGRVELVNGVATVNIDEAARMTEGTFVALNGNVQCFTSNETGWTAVRGKVEGNLLKIEAQEEDCSDTISWLVIGERHDQHMLDTDWTDENGRVITEPEKEKIDG